MSTGASAELLIPFARVAKSNAQIMDGGVWGCDEYEVTGREKTGVEKGRIPSAR